MASLTDMVLKMFTKEAKDHSSGSKLSKERISERSALSY